MNIHWKVKKKERKREKKAFPQDLQCLCFLELSEETTPYY